MPPVPIEDSGSDCLTVLGVYSIQIQVITQGLQGDNSSS